MPESSKALVLGTSHFGGVGSNPTAVKLSVFRGSKLPLIINFTGHIFYVTVN